MFEEEDLLDIFLSTALEENVEPSEKQPKLKEVDIFKDETIDNVQKLLKNDKKSLLHSGDTDSSDDEDNRNLEERKYNDCGKEIKRLISDTPSHSRPINGYNGPRERITWKQKSPLTSETLTPPMTLKKFAEINKGKFDVFIDPVFQLRIVNPLISSAVLQERMIGRDAVQFFQLDRYLQTRKSDKDWVLAGIVASKSAVKVSQKGQKFLIWTLTDLKDDIKTVAVFLFGSAYNQLWKTQVGMVVGLLNPKVLDKKDGSKEVASLSIDNHQKVMFFGTSKDLGTCKSTKKNGEKCNAIVNVNKCEYCVYHIKQEYQKCTQRSDLQSNFGGKGLVALRNKVLGKNEVFYAGKSYMAIPTKKSKKLEQRDNQRLDSLNGLCAFSNNITKAKKRGPVKKKQNAARLDVSVAQRKRDLELLKKLGGATDIESKTNFSGNHSSDVLSLEESKNLALSVISKLKAKKVETPQPPTHQYDRTSDLIVNVDNKKSFSGKISEDVTLDESRTLAKSVIAKLKNMKNNTDETIVNNVADKESENLINEDIFNDDFELDYDDVDDGAKEIAKDIDTEIRSMNGKGEQASAKKENGFVSPKNNKTSANLNKKENASPVSHSSASKDILSPKQSNGFSQTNKNKISPKINDIMSPKNCNTLFSNKDSVHLSNNDMLSPKSSKVAPNTFRNGLSNGSLMPKNADILSPKSSNTMLSNKDMLSSKNSVTLSNNDLLSPKRSKDPLSTPKIFQNGLSNGSLMPKNNDILSPKSSNTLLSNKDTLSPKNAVSLSNNDILSPKSSKVPLSTPKIFQNGFPNANLTDKLSDTVPTLSCFGAQNGFIDLNEPVRKKTMNRAKLNAIKFIQSNGPIKKIDPNSTKGKSRKKRFVPDSDVEELNPKKSKLAESEFISDRFKKMMAVNSRHTDLLEQRDDEEQEKYFKKQEMKEQMEEKMANTFKIACKAVRCLKCKYTSFSASDLCKKEGHPLRVFDATKRFFKCGNCQNRTVSLEIVPTGPCKNCGSGKWERTGMMKEKVIGVAHQLSIRGGEQKFANSVITDANINLLVPESD